MYKDSPNGLYLISQISTTAIDKSNKPKTICAGGNIILVFSGILYP